MDVKQAYIDSVDNRYALIIEHTILRVNYT
jgi:hypothetical protein